jgi:hypothetical protein
LAFVWGQQWLKLNSFQPIVGSWWNHQVGIQSLLNSIAEVDQFTFIVEAYLWSWSLFLALNGPWVLWHHDWVFRSLLEMW